jgi:hypothetical protein
VTVLVVSDALMAGNVRMLRSDSAVGSFLLGLHEKREKVPHPAPRAATRPRGRGSLLTARCPVRCELCAHSGVVAPHHNINHLHPRAAHARSAETHIRLSALHAPPTQQPCPTDRIGSPSGLDLCHVCSRLSRNLAACVIRTALVLRWPCAARPHLWCYSPRQRHTLGPQQLLLVSSCAQSMR